ALERGPQGAARTNSRPRTSGSLLPLLVTLTMGLAPPAAAQPDRASQLRTGRSNGPVGPAARSDWTQFRYSYAHSGYTPYERTLDPSNVSGLIEAWRFRTGASVDSSPAVVGGVVYAG